MKNMYFKYAIAFSFSNIGSQTSSRQGGGGGQVVSVLAFYSDDPSLNPAAAYSFFCKICVWKEQK